MINLEPLAPPAGTLSANAARAAARTPPVVIETHWSRRRKAWVSGGQHDSDPKRERYRRARCNSLSSRRETRNKRADLQQESTPRLPSDVTGASRGTMPRNSPGSARSDRPGMDRRRGERHLFLPTVPCRGRRHGAFLYGAQAQILAAPNGEHGKLRGGAGS